MEHMPPSSSTDNTHNIRDARKEVVKYIHTLITTLDENGKLDSSLPPEHYIPSIRSECWLKYSPMCATGTLINETALPILHRLFNSKNVVFLRQEVERLQKENEQLRKEIERLQSSFNLN